MQELSHQQQAETTWWLWKTARESVQDMRRRIDSGEAHRQAVALSTGNMQTACPVEPTVELSNHGVYELPVGVVAAIEVAQRYDGYKGCSVVVHTEGATGIMKGAASIGSDISAAGAALLMDRIQDLFQNIVRQTGQ
jgi:hypothetical protein